MIVVIDYGMGNLRSVLHKMHKQGIQAILSADCDEIARAEKLILPGVGAFGAGMQNLKQRGILDVLNRKVLQEKTPILGICLGMQLFAQRSSEGDAEGLGWLTGEVLRFDFSQLEQRPHIPHVGWNTIQPQRSSFLFDDLEQNQRFYFTHSYHFVSHTTEDVLATTHYGYNFPCALQRENIYGVQFHPEKSHRRGIVIYKNFAEKA